MEAPFKRLGTYKCSLYAEYISISSCCRDSWEKPTLFTYFFYIIYFLERRVPLFYQLASPSTNVLCAKIGRIGLRKSRDEVVLTVNRRTYGRWKMCDTEGDTETSEMAIDCVVIFDLQTKGEQKNSISLSGERNLRSRINTLRFFYLYNKNWVLPVGNCCDCGTPQVSEWLTIWKISSLLLGIFGNCCVLPTKITPQQCQFGDPWTANTTN